MDDKGHIKMKINDILNRSSIIAEATPEAMAIAKANGIADPNKIQAGKTITVNGQPYQIKAGDTLDKIAAANKTPTTTSSGGNAYAQITKPASLTTPKATDAASLKKAQGLAAGSLTNNGRVPDTAAAPEADKAQVNVANGNISGMRFDPISKKLVPIDSAQPAAADAAPADSNGASLGAAAALANMGRQPVQSSETNPELDRVKSLAGVQNGGVNPALTGGAAQYAAADKDRQPVNANGGQAAQPVAPAAAAGGPQPVKTGSGGTLTTRDGKPVTTRSDNEIWWSQQPGNRGQQYPGDAVAQQQYDARQAAGQKNLDTLKNVGTSISNFFKGGKKEAPAAPAAVNGQAQQPVAEPTNSRPAGGYGHFSESEIARIRHLSGLK